MKKDEIEDVVKQSFKTIHKLFHKIITNFHIEDINEFRTEIKKLRSFLHLLDMESPSVSQIKLSKKMKTFYGYAGIIRNLQLHIQNIENICKTPGKKCPALYLEKLKEEIKIWEQRTRDFINDDNNFLNDEEKILNELPGKLTKESIKKFLDYTVYEIHHLLNRLNKNEALDEIRSFFQDIFYTWPYIKNHTSSLPEVFTADTQRDTCMVAIESFRDKSIDGTLIETYCGDSWNPEERKLLNEFEIIWQNEKQDIEKTITKAFPLHISL